MDLFQIAFDNEEMTSLVYPAHSADSSMRCADAFNVPAIEREMGSAGQSVGPGSRFKPLSRQTESRILWGGCRILGSVRAGQYAA